MMTYIILNLVVLAPIVYVSRSLWHPTLRRPLLILAAALLLMTALFDSFLVSQGIVGYDESKILGLRIGSAPLEDFAYTIAAICLVPWAWQRFNRPTKGHK